MHFQTMILLASMGATAAMATQTESCSEARKEDQAVISKAANQSRSLRGAEPLTWNKNLATHAATVAATCNFDYSNGAYGENIAAGTDKSYTYQKAVDDWSSEEYLYDYNNPGYGVFTRHYTQLVWKSSKEVGCARQFCKSLDNTSFKDAVMIVCEFSPPGNVKTAAAFKANVSEM